MGKNRERGFTLIELLVVIAICFTLAGLLLPILGRAKEKAGGILCAANLRGLALATHLYAMDNNDRLALAGWEAQWIQGKNDIHPAWVGGVMCSVEGVSDSTNTALLMEPKFGHVGPYASSSRLYRCPADRSTTLIAGNQKPRVRSYAMNAFIGMQETFPDYHRFKTLADFEGVSPSEVFSLVDEYEDSLDDGAFALDVYNVPNWWSDIPGSRHGRSGVLSFVDGHVESKRWTDERTVRVSTGAYYYSNPCPNNPDIAWLFQRTTALMP